MHSVELMASSGRLLRRFSLTADCSTAVRSGGVINETRGVQRAAMLATLAEELRPGVLRFGAAVDAVQEAQGGAWVNNSLHMAVGMHRNSRQ